MATGYSNGTHIESAISDKTSGGECLNGLKLAVTISGGMVFVIPVCVACEGRGPNNSCADSIDTTS